MKLETEVGGMLALLIQLEDINLSSRRKTGSDNLFLAKVSVANFLSYVLKLFHLLGLFIALSSLLTLPELFSHHFSVPKRLRISLTV